uniref:Uncharacterized protein n=1 Tax=Rhizophora mucronata TaxID=61149 RepID=A0A2P2PSX0_RHIMU
MCFQVSITCLQYQSMYICTNPSNMKNFHSSFIYATVTVDS